MSGQLARDELDHDLKYGRYVRALTRKIFAKLDPAERAVLWFIFDRTYSFGKEAEIIPYEHFEHGIFTADGECLAAPTGFSISAIKRAITSLAANVIIFKHYDRRAHKTVYSINTAKIFEPSIALTEPYHSSHRAMPQVTQSHGIALTGLSNIEHRETNPGNRTGSRARAHEDHSGKSVMTDPMEALKARLGQANDLTNSARSKRKAKGGALAYERMWQDAFTAAHPEDNFFRWTIAQQAAFKRALERGVPDADRAAFIAYIVAHWTEAVQAKLGWMKDRPALPDVAFATKRVAELFLAFSDDRDPNRNLRRRIATTTAPAADAEKEALKKQVAALEAQVKETKNAKPTPLRRPGASPTQAARKLIANRKPSRDFGSWD